MTVIGLSPRSPCARDRTQGLTQLGACCTSQLPFQSSYRVRNGGRALESQGREGYGEEREGHETGARIPRN